MILSIAITGEKTKWLFIILSKDLKDIIDVLQLLATIYVKMFFLILTTTSALTITQILKLLLKCSH